ncbi:methyltransferase GidB [Chloroherpeton thalassium ATCC 35110]|uniref:Ribosomal RNA small subunit methyltransferase G n=1 Tax=Chloroherpeton thalassium (strain ATCC 35110 / GB-78) TaxID=517418 RepID=B3QTS3_CHLT3|nr:16S rRNA (guanine(527)-N(7))-methyltransferase RsmG [Chloroherpeton thalassium]ACF14271.1 methyltransferase GidB [Chloroherpeton thalassium ATCC 35110]
MDRAELELVTYWTEKHGAELSNAQLERLWNYAEMILEWNQNVNLVSRKDAHTVMLKHILHSLTMGFFHAFKTDESVLDIGTGGGLPGIPLAIAYPETRFLLIDSVGKKINATRDMAMRLGLKNVRTLKARAEDLKKEKFHTVVSRQVTTLKKLCDWARPLLMDGGTLICLKGGDIDEEIEEALVYGATHLCFPEHVETHSVEFLGERFLQKYVLVAS